MLKRLAFGNQRVRASGAKGASAKKAAGKQFRFLVTLPAASAPSPIAADVREEIDYLLRRHFDKIKVETIKQNERVTFIPNLKD